MHLDLIMLCRQMVVFNNHKYMVLSTYYLVWRWLIRLALSVICEWS